jgi:hypothetical protein
MKKKTSRTLVLTRPFKGFLTILTVGPNNRLLPFAFASLANNPPANLTSPGSNVAPRAVPQGKQLEGLGRKWEDPRTPFFDHTVRVDLDRDEDGGNGDCM